MKNILIILLVIATNVCVSQTSSRKTRSDKGKKHNHSASYVVKKALKPKPTKTQKKTK